MTIGRRDDIVFGCSTVSQLPRSDAADLLETALDEGIVHFDTARAYGAGESEQVLGKFIARHDRDGLLVTTKHGLAPPIANQRLARGYERAQYQPKAQFALNLARKVRRSLRTPMFAAGKVRAGLEESLRALGTDYVDLFLLHEASVDEARRSDTLEELMKLRSEGKIRAFGLGSAYDKLGPAWASVPREYSVCQFEHNPLSAVPLEELVSSERKIYTHSALRALDAIRTTMAVSGTLRTRVQEELDVDPGDTQIFASLLLSHSLALNPTGKVVFSTRSAERLRANLEGLDRIGEWEIERQNTSGQIFRSLSPLGVA